MNLDILKLLAQNARYSVEELAVMTGLSEEQVGAEIDELEKQDYIRGYKAIVDWEKLDTAMVSAIIELKITPQANFGFEALAETISKYKQVESVYLMSGVYDLMVLVKGKTFQEVAYFVAKQLAPIKGIVSTATHFVLRRYKEMDIEMCVNDKDERGTVSL